MDTDLPTVGMGGGVTSRAKYKKKKKLLHEHVMEVSSGQHRREGGCHTFGQSTKNKQLHEHEIGVSYVRPEEGRRGGGCTIRRNSSTCCSYR